MSFYNTHLPRQCKACAQASGSEVVQLSLIHVHFHGISTDNCHLQWQQMVHWQPRHTPRVWGNNAGPCGQSTPITVVTESDHGSSYASPSDPSMTASQSHGCRRLFGSTSSSGSVCPAMSSLSSPHLGSVSVVCGLGCCASSSDVEESSGQLTIQWAQALQSRPPLQGCMVHNSPWWTSPQPR